MRIAFAFALMLAGCLAANPGQQLTAIDAGRLPVAATPPRRGARAPEPVDAGAPIPPPDLGPADLGAPPDLTPPINRCADEECSSTADCCGALTCNVFPGRWVADMAVRTCCMPAGQSCTRFQDCCMSNQVQIGCEGGRCCISAGSRCSASDVAGNATCCSGGCALGAEGIYRCTP